MTSKPKNKSHIKNQKGIVTIPFLLVLAIILFFIFSFFGLAMTFAHVSIAQYMSYSTARKLSLAGQSMGEQKSVAVDHYRKLRGQFFNTDAHIGSDDWFFIEGSLDIETRTGYTKGYLDSHFRGGEADDKRGMFYGAGLQFKSDISQFKIPFLMKGNDSSLGVVRIISYLARAPSKAECENFNEQRGNAIKAIYSNLEGIDSSSLAEHREGDNGC